MSRNLIAEQAALEEAASQEDAGLATDGQRGDVSGLSTGEQRRRRRRGRSDQSGGEGTGSQPAKNEGKKRGKRHHVQHLTLTRAMDMVSQAAEFLHTTVMDVDARVADRKHSSIGLAVMLDKWAMLSGRPTQIIQVGEAEARRPAVNKLAAKIVRLVPQGDERAA